MRDVRITVVGDSGTGKSSLITSLINECFVELPAATVLPTVTIPSDVFGSSNAAAGPSNQLTTIIADTSCTLNASRA